MAITNEEAMRELMLRKGECDGSNSGYCCGYYFGLAMAYWRAGVISFAQYNLVTDLKAQVIA